jgi:nicotinamide mononucleotide transporter
MSPLEAIAAALGVINVTLVVRRSVWNYPVGLVMVALYAKVFFDAKLYSDALLQIYFFAIQIYGWWYWLKGRADDGLIVVETMSARARALTVLGSIAGILAVGWFMSAMTDAAAPWWDATVAGLSVVAQILLSRRKIENWVLWIVVDVLAIGLFYSRDLQLTAALYVVFLGLAIWGLVSWYQTLGRARVVAKEAAIQ